jgi:hypothetical protein
MSIRLTRDDPDGIRFFFRQLVDFAFELIGLFAIQSLRFASPFGSITHKRSNTSTQPGYCSHTSTMVRAALCALS